MFDWLASTFELVGGWLVGDKKRVGFLLNSIGCTIWVYVAIDKEVYGLLLVVIPAALINIRNFVKWKMRI